MLVVVYKATFSPFSYTVSGSKCHFLPFPHSPRALTLFVKFGFFPFSAYYFDLVSRHLSTLTVSEIGKRFHVLSSHCEIWRSQIHIGIWVTAHLSLPLPKNSQLIKSEGLCRVRGGVGGQLPRY